RGAVNHKIERAGKRDLACEVACDDVFRELRKSFVQVRNDKRAALDCVVLGTECEEQRDVGAVAGAELEHAPIAIAGFGVAIDQRDHIRPRPLTDIAASDETTRPIQEKRAFSTPGWGGFSDATSHNIIYFSGSGDAFPGVACVAQDHAATRCKIAATCTAVHSPPRAVATPGELSARAMPRC